LNLHSYLGFDTWKMLHGMSRDFIYSLPKYFPDLLLAHAFLLPSTGEDNAIYVQQHEALELPSGKTDCI
jgi:hypothetical protein